MTFVPTQLLEKLEELKLWQGNYDAFLHQKECFKKGQDSQSNYDTIEGLSAFDSAICSPLKSPTDPDKRIISPSKPFAQLLEEKLAEDEPNTQLNPRPKKPFLKKGEGLARYRMTAVPMATRKVRKALKRQHSDPTSLHSARITNTVADNVSEKNNQKNTEVSDILTPLKMPEFVIRPKGTWLKVASPEKENMIEFCEKVQDTQNVTKKQSSLQKIISPTKKKQPLSPVKQPCNSYIIDKINEFALKHFIPPNTSQMSFKGPPVTSPEPGEQTLYERQIEKDLRVFEILEQKAENSSFCSTNTSIVNLLSSTPNKVKRSPRGQNKELIVEEATTQKYHCFVGDGISPSFTDNYLYDKMEEVTKKTALLQKFLVNLRKANENKTSRPNSVVSSPTKSCRTPETSISDQDKWSTEDHSGSQTPSSFYTTDAETTYMNDKVVRLDVGTNTSFEEKTKADKKDSCKDCKDLRGQIENLKKKSKENKVEMETIAEELKCERDQLQLELKKIRKKHEEDLMELNEELESERNKFNKQKLMFDKYVRECQNRPNRKEREEITQLKQELADLKEMVKLKDTKQGATQARLRNHIKQLEKDNSEQKFTIEKLQKENAKLTASQKYSRRPSDAKMLQEINKNLSRLAEETFKKRVISGGDSGEITKTNSKVKKDKEFKEVLAKIKDISDTNAKEREESFGKETCPPHDNSNFENLSLEQKYEVVFGQIKSPQNRNDVSNSSSTEKIEKAFPDGSMEIVYSNGNIKNISPDGNFIRLKYFNGDIKETDIKEKTIRYYYLESNSWHTQFTDGSEVIEYPDGQKHRKHPDGKVEISYPEGSFKTVFVDGTEEEVFPDGSKTIKNNKGEQIILLPNGQKEVHNSQHKRREYPDGTVRILHKDGTVETRYPNGRVRIKDSSGVLVVDTLENVS